MSRTWQPVSELEEVEVPPQALAVEVVPIRDRSIFDPRDYKVEPLPAQMTVATWKK